MYQSTPDEVALSDAARRDKRLKSKKNSSKDWPEAMEIDERASSSPSTFDDTLGGVTDLLKYLSYLCLLKLPKNRN
jgi:hypothetical protein